MRCTLIAVGWIAARARRRSACAERPCPPHFRPTLTAKPTPLRLLSARYSGDLTVRLPRSGESHAVPLHYPPHCRADEHAVLVGREVRKLVHRQTGVPAPTPNDEAVAIDRRELVEELFVLIQPGVDLPAVGVEGPQPFRSGSCLSHGRISKSPHCPKVRGGRVHGGGEDDHQRARASPAAFSAHLGVPGCRGAGAHVRHRFLRE